MKTEYKIIVLSILLGLFIWVADAALDYFIYYQGTFWGLLIYEMPPHEIYVRTLVLGCYVIFGVAIFTVFGKFRRAEEKRRESEKQFRLAVKNSRDVLYKLNLRSGDFDYVSPSVVELGGYTPQEFTLLGVKGVLRRMHPEDRHRFTIHFRNVLRQTVEDGLAPSIEYRWKHNNGGYRWFSDNRTVIRDPGGNPVSLIGSVRDVTEQRKAEWALWESEKKYRTMVETAQEGIGITSPGEKLVFVNRAFASILGYEPSELVGRNLREFVTEERFEVFQMETGKREWGTCSRYETELRHRDGSHRSLLVSASPLYDREGNYDGTLGMVVDITERKKEQEIQSALFRISQAVASTGNLEELLQTTHEALGELIDTTKYFVALYDAETDTYSFPYSVDEDEETDFSTRQLKRSLTDYARRTGKPVLVDEETHKKLMEEGEVELVGRPAPIWLGVPLKTPRGVIGVVAVQHYSDPSAYSEADLDILSFVSGHLAVAIERKRAEEALRNSKEFAETILNSIEDSISIIDTTDFRIVKASQSFLSKLNMEEKEVIGKYCYEVTHRRSKPCEPPDDLCPLAETLRTGCHSSAEHIHYAKDGREIYVEVSASPIINEKGEIPQVIHVARDITERKRAEEALRLHAQIAENMLEGTHLVRESDGVIVYTNPRLDEMFGYGPGELIGKHISVVNFPTEKSPEETAKEIIGSIREHGVWKGEILNIKKDGTPFWCYASTSVFDHPEHGKIFVTVQTDITERKKAEEALQESEAKWRSITENSPDHIMLLDREANIQFFNQTVPDLTKEQVIGTPIYNYVPEDYRRVMKESFERVMKTGQPDQYEVEYKSADGSTQVYETSVGPVLRGDEVVALTLSSRDITERKKAEEALRESEEKFRVIFENANDAIFWADPETGVIINCNEAGAALLEKRKEEIIGQHQTMLHPPQKADHYAAMFKRHMEQKGVVDDEAEVISKSGKEIPVHITASITSVGGESIIQGIFRDISERRKAEEAIRHSEEQLRALFDSAADIVFTKDRQGRYTRVNSACARLHGISEEEFLGKTDFDLFPEEQAKHSAEIDRQVLVEGRTFTGEYDRQVKGKTLTFSVVKTPLHGPDGAIIGLCGIARDITEQKSIEEQFRQAQKMESLGTLAGGVAHDFNNLLGGILGYVGLMKGDYSPGEKHYAMLELVEKAGVRAAELTNQLLAFSRRGKFELRAVDLNNSVEDVLKLLGRTLDRSIEIITELQKELPSVEGDPGQLEQAIINLCVNAAEAMPGGGKLQLETRVVALEEKFARKYLGSDPGDYVLLSVSDTGIGMDSETLSRMFEPFFTTKEVGKGTGLGLSTVYGIVKNHGGYVDVRSQPGKGSTFDIYLPVSKKQFTPPQPRAAELQTGHETILAVDDEEIIRSLLEETLQKLGYKVILANDGEEAVQIYEERKDEIDAVIIDMIMPHVGGRETFREIKRCNPDVRVLLASGYSQDGAAQRILDEGVRGFIQKPFELVELSQKLRQVLD